MAYIVAVPFVTSRKKFAIFGYGNSLLFRYCTLLTSYLAYSTCAKNRR